MFDEVTNASRIIGPFFLFVYMMSMFVIMINFFMAILNDSMEDSKDDRKEETEEAIMAHFMSSYLRTSLRDIQYELKSMVCKKRRKKPKRDLLERNESIYDNAKSDFVMY